MPYRQPFQIAFALRESFRRGYAAGDLRADVLAGLVVGVVALPLSMALAIASGVAPQHGLYTAIVAGGMTALLGGSRVQVSGPTAAFVVLLAPVSARFGVAGLLLASAMAGLVLLAMGLLRLGRLIQFMPYPVTTGFTAGIGLVIASLQLKDFFGLAPVAAAEQSWLERMGALVRAAPTARGAELLVGASTLAVLVVWRRIRSRVPAPLVALALGAFVAWLLERFSGESVATLSSRFGTPEAPAGIPRLPPLFAWPWNAPGPDGKPFVLSLATLEALVPSAFAIAMLGAIESLLAAVVSDGMSGHKHQPDVELMALGTANVVAPFFGGFAATGAIARTATNVRAGARSPFAALTHALFVLVAVVALAPWLGHLPMASLAALLLMVAWNMAEVRHFAKVVRTAPRADTAVLLCCFALTVLFDMTVAVSVGVLLAALLFMHRMIEISGAELIGPGHPERGQNLPHGLLVYDIGGPMFFGAAHKATSQLFSFDRKDVRLVLLDLEDVPAIDATGIVNLESAVERLQSGGVEVWLTGLQRQPREALERAGLLARRSIQVHDEFDDALARARAHLAAEGKPAPRLA